MGALTCRNRSIGIINLQEISNRVFKPYASESELKIETNICQERKLNRQEAERPSQVSILS